jgi:hypothetical protein
VRQTNKALEVFVIYSNKGLCSLLMSILWAWYGAIVTRWVEDKKIPSLVDKFHSEDNAKMTKKVRWWILVVLRYLPWLVGTSVARSTPWPREDLLTGDISWCSSNVNGVLCFGINTSDKSPRLREFITLPNSMHNLCDLYLPRLAYRIVNRLTLGW